ncbi:serine/threonine protein phosphatase [Paenibacillus pasadenensis]|uniref:Serine/threonine protein phosphatase n=1 Tax=Paenibacillus pasadenensis TaxID=217090 RepID=A0A2N5N2N6_9BACL|nr:serine/threonine protein phosphatase [Paenibacillus pasadenensis]
MSDIHGFTAEARRLLQAAAYEPGRDKLFLLGDYIDYEPCTWSSLDEIMELTAGGAVALAGNMERHLQRHLEQELESRGSLDHGSSVQLQFLKRLPLHAAAGGWLFVHAGIRPGVPLERQAERDLIGIREEFWGAAEAAEAPPMHGGGTLETSGEWLPQVQIVFGHTPTHKIGAPPGELWRGPGKLGIDTGAKHGLRLTLVDLTGRKDYSCPTSPAGPGQEQAAVAINDWEAGEGDEPA